MAQLLSDMHLEFDSLFKSRVLPKFEAENLILAGDITEGNNTLLLKEYLKRAKDKSNGWVPKNIIYVPGNHEYWGKDIDTANEDLRKDLINYLPEFNIILLNNAAYFTDTHIFIGATLWSKIDPTVTLTCMRLHKDFRHIKGLNPFLWNKLNDESLEYIAKQLNLYKGDSRRKVVITHHAPSYESIPRRFRGEGLNSCYYTNLDNFIIEHEPDIWVHGHIHNSMDYYIGKTRILANPFGYAGYEINNEFKKDLVF